MTATQNIYQNAWAQNPASDTTALQVIDASATGCSPCSIFGPNAMYNPQYVALTAFRSIGSGSHHAFEATLRKQFSSGIQFDLNYTLSKCIDLGSTRESDGPNGPQGSGLGLIQNPWNPGQERAVCDYDVRNLVSAFMVAELPFGRGHFVGGTANKFWNAVIGGWQISTIWRQSSGLPVGVSNGGYWPTNWNYPPFATADRTGPTRAPPTTPPAAAPICFRIPRLHLMPLSSPFRVKAAAETSFAAMDSSRIDAALSKRFRMFYNEKHSFQIRAEAFNVTNSVRFDVNQMSLSMSNSVCVRKIQWDTEYSTGDSVRRTL